MSSTVVEIAASLAAGQRLGDPVAGLAVTVFICHVGYEVTADVMHYLADDVDPAVITAHPQGWLACSDDYGSLAAPPGVPTRKGP